MSVHPAVLYRFRSIDKLLDTPYEELERQELFFQSPNQLNDPMEGLKDVFWLGDKVLWRNFVRHYVLGVVDAITQCQLTSDDKWIDPQLFPIALSEDLPTDAFRKLYETITTKVLEDPTVQKLIERLASLRRPLRRDGLLFCLRAVHPIVVGIAGSSLQVTTDSPAQQALEIGDNALSALEMIESTDEVTPDMIDAMFAVGSVISNQMALLLSYNFRHDRATRRGTYLIVDFPERYVDSLVEELLHPPWRVACFSSTCTNASMWGVYGDAHRGVALKFKTDTFENRPGIELHGVIGASGRKGVDESEPIEGRMRLHFYEIKYSKRAPEIDFFVSLGQLPFPKLTRGWLHDAELGATPRMAAFDNMESWRRAHWDRFSDSVSTKLEDWRHEKEFRLVRSQILGDGETLKRAQYDFSALQGIVFGTKTTMESKHRIVEIVERKCRENGRGEFEFSQATYSAKTGSIQEVPLKLLKFDKSA